MTSISISSSWKKKAMKFLPHRASSTSINPRVSHHQTSRIDSAQVPRDTLFVQLAGICIPSPREYETTPRLLSSRWIRSPCFCLVGYFLCTRSVSYGAMLPFYSYSPFLLRMPVTTHTGSWIPIRYFSILQTANFSLFLFFFVTRAMRNLHSLV